MNLATVISNSGPFELSRSLAVCQAELGGSITEVRLAEQAVDRALLGGDMVALRNARQRLIAAEEDRQRCNAALDAILSRLGHLG